MWITWRQTGIFNKRPKKLMKTLFFLFSGLALHFLLQWVPSSLLEPLVSAHISLTGLRLVSMPQPSGGGICGTYHIAWLPFYSPSAAVYFPVWKLWGDSSPLALPPSPSMRWLLKSRGVELTIFYWLLIVNILLYRMLLILTSVGFNSSSKHI